MALQKENRVKLNFSIPEESYNKIKKFIDKNGFNKSTLVEKLLLEYITKMNEAEIGCSRPILVEKLLLEYIAKEEKL